MKLSHKVFVFVFLLLMGIIMVYSVGIFDYGDEPAVGGDDNVWGTKLNILLNKTRDVFLVFHTENGTLKAGLNASLFDINITNKLIVTNISANHINTTNGSALEFIVTYLFVNSINGTDFANFNKSVMLGAYQLAADFITNLTNEYARSGYKLSNLSNDLSNGKAVTIITTTFAADTVLVNKQLLVFGNITNVNRTEININASILPSLDDMFNMGNGSFRWKNGNFTGTVEVSILTSPTIKITNLQDLDSSNFFDYSGFSSSATCGQPDQTGAVTCTDISITESQISNLGVYEWRATATNRGNISDFIGGNNSRVNINDQWIKINDSANYASEYSATGFKNPNLTGFIGIPNSSIISVKNITEDKLNVSNSSYASNVNCAGIQGATSNLCTLVDTTGSDPTNPFNSTSGRIFTNLSQTNFSIGNLNDSGFNYTGDGTTNDGNLNLRGSIFAKALNLVTKITDTLIDFASVTLADFTNDRADLWNRANTTTFLGDTNATIISGKNNETFIDSLVRAGNLSTIVRTADAWTYANNQSARENAYFRLENATNDTISKTANVSVALLNLSIFPENYWNFLLYPRWKNHSIVFGDWNYSKNVTSTLTVAGNVTIYNLTVLGDIYMNGKRVNSSIENLNNLNYVSSVTAVSPISSSGGLTPTISINADGLVNDTELSSNTTALKLDQYKSFNWSKDWNNGYVANYINTTDTKNVLINNSPDVRLTMLNITGGVKNATLYLNNSAIWYNGSGICIYKC